MWLNCSHWMHQSVHPTVQSGEFLPDLGMLANSSRLLRQPPLCVKQEEMR